MTEPINAHRVPARTVDPCPNAANHAPRPTGYAPHWADDALLVADQSRCPGCGRWAVWTPKRPDLRIAPGWPPGTCDWGGCDGDGVAERYAAPFDAWLPVCADHLTTDPKEPQ
jgi:hypothetical protein